jgi:hypothetical protein
MRDEFGQPIGHLIHGNIDCARDMARCVLRRRSDVDKNRPIGFRWDTQNILRRNVAHLSACGTIARPKDEQERKSKKQEAG